MKTQKEKIVLKTNGQPANEVLAAYFGCVPSEAGVDEIPDYKAEVVLEVE